MRWLSGQVLLSGAPRPAPRWGLSSALGRCCLSATVPAFVLVLVCFQLCDVELWECLSVLLGKT